MHRRRYALQGSRWKVRALTYRISAYPRPSKLSRAQVDAEIKRALEVRTVTWENVRWKSGNVVMASTQFSFLNEMFEGHFIC